MDARPARYAQCLPPPALRAQVRRLWRFRAADTPTGPVRVLPDGCVDLIWDGQRLFAAGPDRVAAQAALAPGSTLTGIRLAPGAGHALLGIALDEIAGERVMLSDLWGAGASTALEAALHRPGASARPLLAALAARQARPNPRMARLFSRLAAGDAPSVARLAGELAVSERGLRRLCQLHFGYGAKTLDRILRLQRLLGGEWRFGHLTDAALSAGYADAAHLAHDASDLTGLTPSELLRQHGRMPVA